MKNIKKLDDKYIGNTFKRYPVLIDKGAGALLYDKAKKPYIDMVAGVAVNVLGYNHREINSAILKQMKKFIHLSNWFYSETQVKLAEQIVKSSFADKVLFVNSGAEASEVAFKVARKWGMLHKNGANEIITMRNSFHGRTIAALTATGQEKFHKYLNPVSPGFLYADFNDLSSVKKLVSKNTAAIFVEPIQAEGGVNVITKEFIAGLKQLCDENKILLILDEVQTGLGRTGKTWCYQHFAIKPDLMTFGKGIGGGLPLAGVALSREIAPVYGVGDHGTTMGGNPVACAAGNVVMKYAASGKLHKDAETKGAYFRKALKAAGSAHIKDVRGMGLLCGVEFTGDIGAQVTSMCLEAGLIINCPKPNIIRMVPPVVITKQQLDKAVKIIINVLEKI